MTRYLKTAFTLFAISAVCTALCAFVNQITAPLIAANNESDRLLALEAVSAGYTIGEETEGNGESVSYLIPLTDESGELKGYILGLTANGYGGPMDVIASYNPDGSIIAAKMSTNSETPGIGKKAEEPWYMEMFTGLGGDSPIPLSKSELSDTDSAAVSGASITFNGVTSALKAGSDYVKSLGGEA